MAFVWIASTSSSFLFSPYHAKARPSERSSRLRARRKKASCSISSSSTAQAQGNAAAKLDPSLSCATIDKSLLSPMMREYVMTKSSLNPAHLLLYRVGDFYEAFFEDAHQLSTLCDITLTSKDGGKLLRKRVPMSGVPHHALQAKLRPVLEAGVSVAIAEQLTPVRPGFNLVERRVTRILTPGTLADEDFLPPRASNFLASIFVRGNTNIGDDKQVIDVAIADVSTGDFRSGQLADLAALRDFLIVEKPSEVVIVAPPQILTFVNSICRRIPIRQLPEGKSSSSARDILVEYLRSIDSLIRLESVRPLVDHSDGVLELDATCVRNMEIVASMRAGDANRGLCAAVDRTTTPMGARRVRSVLLAPILSLQAIQNRHQVVGSLVDNPLVRNLTRNALKPIADIERLAGRVASERASPRDVRSLAVSIVQLPHVANAVLDENMENTQAGDLIREIIPPDDVLEISKEICSALVDPAPAILAAETTLTDTAAALGTSPAIFVPGYDGQLDGLRHRAEKPSMWAADFEESEQKRTGWSKLRVKHVKRLGFVIRIPRTYAERLCETDPAVFARNGYERVHSTKAELRFRSDTLADFERAHHQALSGVVRRELALFCQLRAKLAEYTGSIRIAANALALLDVLVGFAEVSSERNYCRPSMHPAEERICQLNDLRHPVVEQQLPANQTYVPNSLEFGGDVGIDTIILTGPNAAGKSCAIRSVGLAMILAQAGCFIPARQGSLSICERILTRVGAVDDVTDAMSSFQVEMAETAHILRKATGHSLVLLDELGRGTDVVDGIGIACSVAETLSSGNSKGVPRTLFVTHYHELNSLANVHGNIAAMAMQVVESDSGQRIATHRVIPGKSFGSLGIEVARKAGFPEDVVKRADDISKALRIPAKELGRALVAEFNDKDGNIIHTDERINIHAVEDGDEMMISLRDEQLEEGEILNGGNGIQAYENINGSTSINSVEDEDTTIRSIRDGQLEEEENEYDIGFRDGMDAMRKKIQEVL